MNTSSQIYGGRYAILERVGTGGMAEVYRARDELLGRQVAVKALSRRFSGDRTFVERFRREAQAAAGLNHPNIVSLYDYGVDGEDYFIVMEFIEGRSLDEIIHREGPLLPERAAEIAADVTRALERAHLTGLVHRDIKPGNIMVTPTGQTKVTDFGIVRAISGDGDQTMTQTGMVIGTAAYLSPEQAQGNPVDPRSDVYSLGIVLYEMLTGRAPFSGETPLAIAYKHVREDPVPPSRLNPDVPGQLDSVVMKALAKNPDNRYASAAELREDLERFLGGQRVGATPILGTETMATPVVGRRTEVFTADEYEPIPPPPERRSRAGWYVLLTLLLLAGLAALAYLLVGGFTPTPTVAVPNVVGEKIGQAKSDLRARGLTPEVRHRHSSKAAGIVLGQDPKPRAKAEKGSKVTLFVSSGPEQVTVPSLTNLTVAQAKKVLDKRHLKLGPRDLQPSTSVDKGHIITAQYPAGDDVPIGTKVGVTVSSGPPLVNVPSVTGASESAAISEIRGAGLVADVVHAPSNDVSAGLVISQDPGPGVDVRPDTHIQIVVSTGPKPRPMPNVTSQNADQAQQELQDQFHLVVTQRDTTKPCAQPPGTVCSQDPAPHHLVKPGDHATLFVQPEATSPSPSPSKAGKG